MGDAVNTQTGENHYDSAEDDTSVFSDDIAVYVNVERETYSKTNFKKDAALINAYCHAISQGHCRTDIGTNFTMCAMG